MDKLDGVVELNQLKTDTYVNGNDEENHLTATTYNSGFQEAHDTYNALSAASDGKYLLCVIIRPDPCRR
jgi:hypothetical protein